MNAETPAIRLRRARQSAGLEPRDVAAQIGIGFEWYADLEMHDDDLPLSLSLEQLCRLASVVHTDPLQVLIGDPAASVERTIQFTEIVQRLAGQMAALGLDVEQFGDHVGWDVARILTNAEEMWDLNTDGFRDLATAAGVDWVSAFPRTPRR